MTYWMKLIPESLNELQKFERRGNPYEKLRIGKYSKIINVRGDRGYGEYEVRILGKYKYLYPATLEYEDDIIYEVIYMSGDFKGMKTFVNKYDIPQGNIIGEVYPFCKKENLIKMNESASF